MYITGVRHPITTDDRRLPHIYRDYSLKITTARLVQITE